MDEEDARRKYQEKKILDFQLEESRLCNHELNCIHIQRDYRRGLSSRQRMMQLIEPQKKRMSYFNNQESTKKVNMYDVAFNPPPGYNQRMHRDDRQDLRIIHENIYQQEKDKRVPALVSLQYARPWAKRLDPHDTTYFLKVGVGAFYSRGGINVTPDLERQCIKVF